VALPTGLPPLPAELASSIAVHPASAIASTLPNATFRADLIARVIVASLFALGPSAPPGLSRRSRAAPAALHIAMRVPSGGRSRPIARTANDSGVGRDSPIPARRDGPAPDPDIS
jgi:hypothetical protein